MGAVTGFLGLNGKGAGYQAQGVPIAQPITAADVTAGNQQANVAAQQLSQYAGSTAPGGQQGLNAQQALSGQLMAQTQGGGPNPAQAALNQNTGANIAAQTAMMAGQRGASANPALIARQAAQQGAATQQNAIGQAATLQAQQQLAAQQNLMALSAQQAGQQQSAIGNYSNAAQGIQGNLIQGLGQQNQANVNMQGNINSSNAGVQSVLAGGVPNLIGGIGKGAGMAVGMANGGVVDHLLGMACGGMADGGKVDALLSPGEIVLDPREAKRAAHGGPVKGRQVPGKAEVKGDSEKNDKVPAKLKPGSVVVPRTKAKDDAKASAFVSAVMARTTPKRKK